MANYKQFIPFIRKWEGGLTGNPSDSASADPSPCGTDDRYDAPYHTNKGVTWSTFKDNADRLGYVGSCANFLEMPDEIWEKIYKDRFWDKIYGDDIKNQGIANAYASWAWGSGLSGSRSLMRKMLKEEYGATDNEVQSNREIADILNSLGKFSEGGNQRLFDAMVRYRRQFFIDISMPGTANAQFRQGWLNRLDDFQSKNAGFVTGRKTIILPIIIMALGALVYFGYKRT